MGWIGTIRLIVGIVSFTFVSTKIRLGVGKILTLSGLKMVKGKFFSRAERRNFLDRRTEVHIFSLFLWAFFIPLRCKHLVPLGNVAAVALRAWCLHQLFEVEFLFHAVGEAGHHGEGFALKVGDFDVAVG